MPIYQFVVDIQYKSHVRDPRGETIKRVLNEEYEIPVKNLRLGKSVHLEVEAETKEEALKLVERACEKLLVNTVTETFEIKGL
ncbi:phosphoribosylformylglycinamidine synthase subunit PurS [Fervidobacterium sp. 2310opik-2]|uniref:phosphoribosylformylglycinamidine synthase subunit PurS n=1 Tax=Fervidobacterium sp. 2310opik-2 TaxID=1755815 RepID=UPI000C0358FF|nr:phosphoribosylformylglycinamidine synthase subunit PurS [Fervidobacterium sp. 2310opik-2]KAF2962276.1 phosphoribosylformylglycinamidine synthase [Fervidobacterium sp. 2310opik-2]PHJ14445.1 phosphoribosylformylglycinamidine synthase [Fervidobacterium sp. SC_NGM5_G05]